MNPTPPESVDLAFETEGSGPPLLVLHGLFGSGRNWRSVARQLGTSHTVYSVDLRNHGASPWSDTMSYPAMAEDLRRFIEVHGLRKAALMGHSMGGKAAMALALSEPDTIGQLIVVDIAPVSYADTMTPFAEAMRAPEVLASASRTEAQRQLESRLPDPAVAPFLLQNLVTNNDHFDWRINLAAITMSMPVISDFPAALKSRRFGRHMTAIVGQNSNYVAGGRASAFAPMFDDVTVEVIAGAGHWVHADRPQVFVDAVRRTLGV